MKSNCAAARPRSRSFDGCIPGALGHSTRKDDVYNLRETKAAREAGTTTGGMNQFRQLAIIIEIREPQHRS
jgi:hypothetical protein